MPGDGARPHYNQGKAKVMELVRNVPILKRGHVWIATIELGESKSNPNLEEIEETPNDCTGS